jgi:hypothetical protein
MSTDHRQLLRRPRIVVVRYPLTAEFPLFPVPPTGAVAIVGAPALAGGSGGATRVLALPT